MIGHNARVVKPAKEKPIFFVKCVYTGTGWGRKWFLKLYAIIAAEVCMQSLGRHLPFALVIFLVLVLGLTDQAIGAEPKILASLLAPVLWLGLYVFLGSDRAA